MPQSAIMCLMCLLSLLASVTLGAPQASIGYAVAGPVVHRSSVPEIFRYDLRRPSKELGTLLLAGLPNRFPRRDILGVSAAYGAALRPWRQLARAAESKSAPIAVLGASGRTGALCVNACLRRGLLVRALTRSGACPPGVDASSPLLSVIKCDIRDVSNLAAVVAGSSGVIYAASASKNGGNARDIDNLGAVAAAEACLKAKVPKFALISSTAATRPSSLGYKFTNTFVPGYAKGIMDQKLLGEQGAQQLYENDKSGCSLIIVRPGGLEETSIVQGASGLEVSQGDVLAGVISRPDLADFMVELMRSDKINFDTALEVYTTESTQPCEGRLKSFMSDERVARLHGTSWQDLFTGVKANDEFYVPS